MTYEEARSKATEEYLSSYASEPFEFANEWIKTRTKELLKEEEYEKRCVQPDGKTST